MHIFSGKNVLPPQSWRLCADPMSSDQIKLNQITLLDFSLMRCIIDVSGQ